jgi:hypothetical protein
VRDRYGPGECCAAARCQLQTSTTTIVRLLHCTVLFFVAFEGAGIMQERSKIHFLAAGDTHEGACFFCIRRLQYEMHHKTIYYYYEYEGLNWGNNSAALPRT